MSAAGRGAARDVLDRYDTPEWAVHRLLDRIGHRLPIIGATWREPACGSGAIVRAVRSWCAARGQVDPRWLLSDIEPRYPAAPSPVHRLDGALDMASLGRADVCPTNPPYRYALAFARQAVECADVVALLLRVNWLEGATTEEPERAAFLRAHPPDVFVLPERPHFEVNGVPKKGSDACAYAWVIWGLDGGRWALLDSTPKSVRHPRRQRRRRRLTAPVRSEAA